jgi:hypothetical protein
MRENLLILRLGMISPPKCSASVIQHRGRQVLIEVVACSSQ